MSESRAEFAVTVKDGQVHVDEHGRFARWKGRSNRTRWMMVFEDEQEWRTNAQNRRYRALCAAFSEWSGYSPDEAHLELLKLFSSYERRNEDGSVTTLLRHTRHMSKREMTEFTNRVERFLVEQSVPMKEWPGAAA